LENLNNSIRENELTNKNIENINEEKNETINFDKNEECLINRKYLEEKVKKVLLLFFIKKYKSKFIKKLFLDIKKINK
jgi:hypothetical protein